VAAGLQRPPQPRVDRLDAFVVQMIVRISLSTVWEPDSAWPQLSYGPALGDQENCWSAVAASHPARIFARPASRPNTSASRP
jgi:hypothetical protein